MKKWITAVLGSALVLFSLSGCGTGGTTDLSSTETEDSAVSSATGETGLTQTDADMFTDRDYRTDYDENDCVLIQLDGSSATASSDSVEISGSTITITEEASYLISGTLDDGMIIVNAPDTAKLQLIFNGVTINSETSAPLYILEADKVFLTLADNTDNTLSNGGSFTAIDDSNIDSVIFSRQDLTMNGSGSLTVTSPAGHGIVSKDDLKITGGTYYISSASQGLDANDSIRITGDTSLTISAGKDGIHAENDEDASLGFVYISDGNIDIEAEGDGISAGSYMQIMDGTFQILAGGGSENGSKASSDSWGDFPGGNRGQRDGAPGASQQAPGNSRNNPGNPTEATETSLQISDISQTDSAETDDASTSMKGLKAGGDMLISAGSFSIDSADDSVHSNGSVTVNGGTFDIASGDDAFHADDTLTVTAGTISISECYEGLEALHLDIQGGEITLTASDDGLNAAGGTDSSGTGGGRDAMTGSKPGGSGGAPDSGMSSSSEGTITISGGTLYISASGDGIDSNGSLTISGGYTVVTGPSQGDTSTLDYDVSAVITGGTFIGTGASGMAQTFSDSEQGVVAASVEEQSAGTTVILTDQSGNELISFTPELSYTVVIISSPDLVSGETYILSAGSVSGEIEAD